MGVTPDQQRALRNQNIGRLFLQAQRDYQRRALQKLHALGYSALSPAHITVLSQLADQATRTVVLAERVGITKQSMSDLVRDLEAHGYVARTADPRDKRAAIIGLTAAGEQFLAETDHVKREIEREYMARIGERGFEQLLQLLTQLLQNDNIELV